MDNYLQHYGIPGMKWGVRRQKKNSYKSTGIRAMIAKKSNDKIDESFKNWGENAKKRDNAIELGKKANLAKMAYEKNKSDKSAKAEYKQANKAYKQALSKNTTYRKGVVRQEVGRDASRKYLSEAKKIKKQLDKNPSNKQLQKQYNNLMSKHDIERAKARRATEVSSKRMRAEASIKRSMTMTAKTAVGVAAVGVGVYAVNKYLTNHNVTLNGQKVQFGAQSIQNIGSLGKTVRDYMGYLY